MKKSSLIITIILFIAIVILFVSIMFPKKESNTSYKNINFTNNTLLAVAYLSNELEVTSLYNNIIDNVSVIEYEEENTLDSEELFLIIPKYVMDINIYRVKLNDNGEISKEELIKTINKPFIIKSYTSDTMSNILLEFTYKKDNYEYYPRLSLKDNKVNINDIVLDITKYDK